MRNIICLFTLIILLSGCAINQKNQFISNIGNDQFYDDLYYPVSNNLGLEFDASVKALALRSVYYDMGEHIVEISDTNFCVCLDFRIEDAALQDSVIINSVRINRKNSLIFEFENIENKYFKLGWNHESIFIAANGIFDSGYAINPTVRKNTQNHMVGDETYSDKNGFFIPVEIEEINLKVDFSYVSEKETINKKYNITLKRDRGSFLRIFI